MKGVYMGKPRGTCPCQFAGMKKDGKEKFVKVGKGEGGKYPMGKKKDMPSPDKPMKDKMPIGKSGVTKKPVKGKIKK